MHFSNIGFQNIHMRTPALLSFLLTIASISFGQNEVNSVLSKLVQQRRVLDTIAIDTIDTSTIHLLIQNDQLTVRILSRGNAPMSIEYPCRKIHFFVEAQINNNVEIVSKASGCDYRDETQISIPQGQGIETMILVTEQMRNKPLRVGLKLDHQTVYSDWIKIN